MTESTRKASVRGTVLALLASVVASVLASTSDRPTTVACDEKGIAFIDTRLCAEAVGVADIDTLTPIGFMLNIH